MEFLIIAHDGTDPGAPERRKKARPAHIEAADRLRRAGNLIVGGAILDDDGGMIGSTAIVDFDDRAALDEWLRGEPYVTGDVWRDVSVRPFRITVGPRGASGA